MNTLFIFRWRERKKVHKTKAFASKYIKKKKDNNLPVKTQQEQVFTTEYHHKLKKVEKPNKEKKPFKESDRIQAQGKTW
jgi:hypothetical protein